MGGHRAGWLSSSIAVILLIVPRADCWTAAPRARPWQRAATCAVGSRSIVCKQASGQAGKQVADNRLARSRYEYVERFEAGIALTGTEVKSCRAGNINLRDGFARVSGGEVWLENVHISKHQSSGAYFQHDERRPRRLLLRKREINKIARALEQQGLTIVPTRAYFNQRNLLKVDIALAKGLKNYDKRQQLKDRVQAREVAREVKAFVNR